MSGGLFKGPPAPSHAGFGSPLPCLVGRDPVWEGQGVAGVESVACGLTPGDVSKATPHPDSGLLRLLGHSRHPRFSYDSQVGAARGAPRPPAGLAPKPGSPPVPRPAPWPGSSLPPCTPRAHQMQISLHAPEAIPEAIPKAGSRGHPPTALSWGLGREFLRPQPPPCLACLP